MNGYIPTYVLLIRRFYNLNKKVISIALIFITILIAGCTHNQAYKGQQVKDFRSNIMNEYKDITGLNISYSSHSIDFKYTLKPDYNEEAVKPIFTATREFIQSNNFQTEFFAAFFSKYYNGVNTQKVYPKTYITFEIKDNKTKTYIFFASNYETTYDSSKENIITNYRDWYYRNPDGSDIKLE